MSPWCPVRHLRELLSDTTDYAYDHLFLFELSVVIVIRINVLNELLSVTET